MEDPVAPCGIQQHGYPGLDMKGQQDSSPGGCHGAIRPLLAQGGVELPQRVILQRTVMRMRNVSQDSAASSRLLPTSWEQQPVAHSSCGWLTSGGVSLLCPGRSNTCFSRLALSGVCSSFTGAAPLPARLVSFSWGVVFFGTGTLPPVVPLAAPFASFITFWPACASAFRSAFFLPNHRLFHQQAWPLLRIPCVVILGCVALPLRQCYLHHMLVSFMSHTTCTPSSGPPCCYCRVRLGRKSASSVPRDACHKSEVKRTCFDFILLECAGFQGHVVFTRRHARFSSLLACRNDLTCIRSSVRKAYSCLSGMVAATLSGAREQLQNAVLA